MIQIDDASLIGKGSNSKVYRCIYNGTEYAAKIPHSLDRFISCALQVDAMKLCEKQQLSFVLPKVVFYDDLSDKWGEILVMEKLNDIYPVDFLMRTGIIDREYITAGIAKAIAELHNIGISGFDAEFYWSFEYKKIVILDLGPRYTIGYTAAQMIEKHYDIINGCGNRMPLWNIVSELLDEQIAMRYYPGIISGELLPDIGELINAADNTAEQKHIRGVASNHYLQLFGECPLSSKNACVDLFLKTYLRECNIANFIYVNSFREAFTDNISNSEAFLYLSKHKTLSKMSNSVKIM